MARPREMHPAHAAATRRVGSTRAPPTATFAARALAVLVILAVVVFSSRLSVRSAVPAQPAIPGHAHAIGRAPVMAQPNLADEPTDEVAPAVTTGPTKRFAAAKNVVPATTKSSHSDDDGDSGAARRPVTWTARGLYLPISKAALRGFKLYQAKQEARDPALRQSWARDFPQAACLRDVPECEFFDAAGLPLLFAKCCAEHTKLFRAFHYAMDVADANGLEMFLDSGTLLSAIRDGEQTLVPWETDIDLGIVGVEPALVARPFKAWAARIANEDRELARLRSKSSGKKSASSEKLPAARRHHLFAACLTKVSKNASRHGRCRDAHYVYHAETDEEAGRDTSRVEIWPFWPENGQLIHPTRKRLTVPESLVLPLRRCWFWGRRCWCPNNATGYLDHEYGPSWRRPKTIHWGQNNVHALTDEFTTRPPRPGDPPPP